MLVARSWLVSGNPSGKTTKSYVALTGRDDPRLPKEDFTRHNRQTAFIGVPGQPFPLPAGRVDCADYQIIDLYGMMS